MQVLNQDQAVRRTRILRLNILLGLVVFITTIALMATGEYSTLAERKAADHTYNIIMLISVLYMAGTWFFCAFTKPFWKPTK